MKASTRIAASAILAVAVALGTAGCTMLVPQATTMSYEPSDGVSGHTGQVDIRNAMLITAEGSSATLVASFVTAEESAHTMTVQYETATGAKKNETFTVEPNTVVTLPADASNPIVFENIDAPAGSLFEVYFQYDDEPGVQLKLPVLTGTLDHYSTLTPTPAP